MALDPSIDMDMGSGADISGWPHVLQSLTEILITFFGARIMREWFGSAVPRFLGEPLNQKTIVPFFAAIASAIEQWEPRYRVTRIVPEWLSASGNIEIVIEGEYRPRALLGDFTVEGARRITVYGGLGNSVVVNG